MRATHAICDRRIPNAASFGVAGLSLAAMAMCAAFILTPWIPVPSLFVGAASAEQAEGKSGPQATIYTCSMHPQVMQDKPGNCPICGMKLVPLRQETSQPPAASEAGATPAERKILYWWDPMIEPPYISDKPGKSPMGMDLVPVYADQVRGGPVITVDPVVTQNMGIRIAQVETGQIRSSLRTVGALRAAEPNQHDVTARVSGYIERLYADTEGMLIKQGSPLFDLYSPDLLVAEEEMLAAKQALEAMAPGTDPAVRAEAEGLVASARRKLELWNVPDQAIDAVLSAGKASRAITFRSPATGFVTDKTIVAGSAVESGQKVLRIVDQSTVWLDARIYENQVPLVKVGQKVTASVAGYPERSFSGSVIFLNPAIDPETRTLAARIAFPNSDLALKPGMYATVEIAAETTDQSLQVPREAVIDTGVRQIVFVSLGGGRFEPRIVRTGIETTDGIVQILEGLAPGETVVTSGQFLLDTESRTREAIQKMTDSKLLAAGERAEQTAPPAETTPAGGPAADPTAEVDAILSVYLPMAEALAADTPLEHSALAALVKAAEALAAAVGQGPTEPIAKGILEAARAMPHQGIEDQRSQFKALSHHVVNFVEHVKPSAAIGAKLHVMHCPMYPGDWLQTKERVANPFYGKSMLECGTITRTYDLKSGE